MDRFTQLCHHAMDTGDIFTLQVACDCLEEDGDERAPYVRYCADLWTSPVPPHRYIVVQLANSFLSSTLEQLRERTTYHKVHVVSWKAAGPPEERQVSALVG